MSASDKNIIEAKVPLLKRLILRNEKSAKYQTQSVASKLNSLLLSRSLFVFGRAGFAVGLLRGSLCSVPTAPASPPYTSLTHATAQAARSGAVVPEPVEGQAAVLRPYGCHAAVGDSLPTHCRGGWLFCSVFRRCNGYSAAVATRAVKIQHVIGLQLPRPAINFAISC